MRMFYLFPLLLVFFGIFAATPFVFGQQHGGYDAYDVLVSNSFPSPGQYVDLTIRSNKSFVSGVRSVRWYADNVERKDYADKLEFTEIIGSSPKRITAYIHYFNVFGEKRYTEISRLIRPVIFDILWEADSVVTPLYKGHKLAGPQVPVKISAKVQYVDSSDFTHTENDFSFRWMIDSRYHKERGPGVSSVLYEKGGDYFNRYIIIRAEATLISDGEVSFERTINVPIVEPRILVYPHSLLYGLSQKKVISQETLFDGEKITASVYPFYFSQTDFAKDAIQYKWFVNNEVSHLKEGRKLDVSIEGNEGVLVPVRVFVQNEHKDLQQTDTTFSFRL